MNTNIMKWNVYYHNFNQNKIEVFDIFNYYNFYRDVKELLWIHKTKNRFAENLKKELSYYFRSRAEWETVIKPWCGGDYEGIKIDVYDQIMLNWDLFVDYCWNFREAIEEQ